MSAKQGQTQSYWLFTISFLMGIILASGIFMLYEVYLDGVNPDKVNDAIQQGIISADIELDKISEHETSTRERVVVIREQVWAEIEALPPDALVTRALERAERMRGIVTSGDNQDAGGVFAE